MRRGAGLLLTLAMLAGVSCASSPEPIRIGAVYPLSGAQGPGASTSSTACGSPFSSVERRRRRRRASGRARPRRHPSADAAPRRDRAAPTTACRLVFGSYGGTISEPAAEAICATGHAVLGDRRGGRDDRPRRAATRVPRRRPRVRSWVGTRSRSPPTSTPRCSASTRLEAPVRGHVRGRRVRARGGAGCARRARGSRLRRRREVRVRPRDVNMHAFVHGLAEEPADVVFVSAYLHDAIVMRREMVRQDLDVLVGIGTSSSYCMPKFGMTLGKRRGRAVRLGQACLRRAERRGLTPDGRALLERAQSRLRRPVRRHDDRRRARQASQARGRCCTTCSPRPPSRRRRRSPPPANAVDAAAGLAAQRQRVAVRGEPGTVTAGANVLASSVVWQWQAPGEYAVVWPPRYATRVRSSGSTRCRERPFALARRRSRDRRGLRGDGTVVRPPQPAGEATAPGRARAADRRTDGSAAPELAATNQKPIPGTFTVELGKDGSKTAVVTTDDAQVTVTCPRDRSRARRASARSR